MAFEPFEAVQSELAVVDKAPLSESYGRVDYTAECEAAVNEQINIEYNVSYVYHAMYSYFARDNVGLPGIAAFFKNESLEERHHAEMLMDFQVLRGGKVALQVRWRCSSSKSMNDMCLHLFTLTKFRLLFAITIIVHACNSATRLNRGPSSNSCMAI